MFSGPKEIHVTIKLQTFTDNLLLNQAIKLINFPVALYRTIQKFKSTGKGGVDMGRLTASPGLPWDWDLLITEIQ